MVAAARVPDDRALEAAYDACVRLARAHYENFPVASWLLPAAMRPHIAAIYAFARVADDLADEGTLAPAERRARLRAWGERLDAVLAGVPPGDDPHAFIFVALRHSCRACGLPASLFHDLLSAFAQDIEVRRYARWADLLDYCRRSANPVGRLVLRVAGCEDEDALLASDAVCTALQLTNFWQDLAIDWARGRLYVPAEVYVRHRASPDTLDPAALTPAWRAALAECARFTRALFDRGRPVADAVKGRLRYELRLTWLGGRRVLDRLERAGFDTVRARPTLGPRDAPALAWGVLRWPASTTARPGPTLTTGFARWFPDRLPAEPPRQPRRWMPPRLGTPVAPGTPPPAARHEPPASPSPSRGQPDTPTASSRRKRPTRSR